jgi:hypothetical protein
MEAIYSMRTEGLARSRTMKAEIRFAAAVLLLLGITLFQMAGLPQPVTGPAVNAALFTAALWLGPWYAVAVGMCTPVVAFARGILPAPLAPMIPFIALGNGLMVGLFALAGRRFGTALGVVAGSVAKFILLATAVNVFVQIPQPAMVMMQWPQLLTALGGGFLVVAVHYGWQKPRRHGDSK